MKNIKTCIGKCYLCMHGHEPEAFDYKNISFKFISVVRAFKAQPKEGVGFIFKDVMFKDNILANFFPILT